MRVTILTQPRRKITYKYLKIKTLHQIYLIVRYKIKKNIIKIKDLP